MRRPVIALLTDFGLTDHYVAAMKGVVLGICPDVALLDITHDIAPQDVLGAALELEAVAPYLPAGSVVVGVVDPGVGSARRGVVIEARGLRFVGPDNGLFSLAIGRDELMAAVEITNRAFTLGSISRTFEGRDRFAPVAAWAALGTAIDAFGPAVTDPVTLAMPPTTVTSRGIEGVVLRVDRFGNVITNIRRDEIAAIGEAPTVAVADARIDALSTTYAAAAPGALCALIGSTDRLEISINGGNAAASLGVTRGSRVHMWRRSGA